MKKYLTIILAAGLMMTGCDSLVRDELINLHDQLDILNSRLDELCRETNENLSALSAIVNAIKDNDFVEEVTAVYEEGEIIGYEITFSKNGKVTVYNGKDGKDGKDGNNGTVPAIGLRQDTDGIWYWTINGEWLLDEDEQKVRASSQDGSDGPQGDSGENGNDGVTPTLKISNGYWLISYDNGKNWENLGKATGKDGENGQDAAAPESIFTDISVENESIVFTLKGGQQLTVGRNSGLNIQFEETSGITCQAGKPVRIAYTIQGGDIKTTVKCLTENGWKATVEATDTQTGYICVTPPDPMVDGKVLVFVCSGDGRTYMTSLTFVEGRPMLEQPTYNIDHQGGELKITVRTRDEIIVKIPVSFPWITLKTETKATERVDTLKFEIGANGFMSDRTGKIELWNSIGEHLETFEVFQYGNYTESGFIDFKDPEVAKICVA
ncbi:MAG: PL29 family lyase N-terminal domain-containing protein [Candidatus Cryptobacteroides sp.]